MTHTYYDFFAGGGMASFGLGPKWRCLFANEIDPRKAESYRQNHFGGEELLLKDVADVSVGDLPGVPDLIWASFPCQDLSLAGRGAGLSGKRSGMFVPFWKLVCELHELDRAPKIIALENVYGAVRSNGGRDFAAILNAISGLGFRVGAIVADAIHFLPQSRPRLFIIGVRDDLTIPDDRIIDEPCAIWHPPALVEGCLPLSNLEESRLIWWNIDAPPLRNMQLSSLIEEYPVDVKWNSAKQTNYLISLMSDVNLAKVESAKRKGQRVIGTIYRRTRTDREGVKHQRAEVRFDENAGCIRTPGGGSSRQTIIVVEGDQVRTRLLSGREAASLMGLPQEYVLPPRYNDAYKLIGDGLAVPVVKHLATNIFEPILEQNRLALAA